MPAEVERFMSSDGRTIYRFPVRAFPKLIGYIHLVDDGQQRLLVDCGSGQPESNEDLVAGLAAIGGRFGVQVGLADLDGILITHGHIDHFGGLPFVRQFTDAPIGVHILDRRVVSNFDERLVLTAQRMADFLHQAGVEDATHANLMGMYLYAKQMYQSVPTQFLLDEAQGFAGMEVIHVPGHCSGQVCLRLGNTLLAADHILPRTSPHQAPESITSHTGLSHYFDSLQKMAQMPGIELGLGGHEAPMFDIYTRMQEIYASHEERLDKVWSLCKVPQTVSEISKALFGSVSQYTILLALEEAGAHVEYLFQRGMLQVANLAEIEAATTTAVVYEAV